MWVHMARTIRTEAWCVVIVCVMVIVVVEVNALSGPNVCMVKQKYNITKRVKYRAPMSVRTYEWCFSMPPRCSRWSTEMRDLTRLEYQLEAVPENNRAKLYWDRSIITDRTILANKPDIVLMDWTESQIFLVDITIPYDENLVRAEADERSKYLDLAHETEERIAEVAVCCPGYKMKDISCVPICTNGKTGPGCTEDCPPNKWGPNCVNTCKKCKNGFCSRLTGECECVAGWQGESCDTNIPPMTSSTTLEELLTPLSTKTATTNITPKFETSTALTTPKAIITTQYVEMTTSESITFPTVPATSAVETTPMITTTESTPKITAVIIPKTSTTLATTTTTKAPQIITNTDNILEEVTSFIVYTQTSPKLIEFDNSTTINNVSTTSNILTTEEVTRRLNTPDYRKETNVERTTEMIIPVKEISDVSKQKAPTEIITVPEVPSREKISDVSREDFHNNTLRIETTTVKLIPSTIKIKPKEIWIRPAQKGEIPIADGKAKMAHEFPRHKIANNKELMTPTTTPKTIIVSIIPTSISYSTFKRIALTSSYLANKNSTNALSYNITENITSTKAMLAVTEKPQMKLNTTKNKEAISIKPSVTQTTVSPSISRIPLSKTVTKSMDIVAKLSEINKTNSMVNYNKSTSTVTETSSATLPARNDLHRNPITDNIKTTIQLSTERTRHFVEHITTNNSENVTLIIQLNNSKVIEKDINTANVTKNLTKFTTEGPIDDEEFHILTEPEHITAVMGDKGTDRSSVNLISVISIAGGVMMAVITVAVIIVMIERCKKPRYEDIRKINDIRMQVMIDNSEAPPPYVRSIFHTPLPEPPSSERCHYQPISTLDRNLKQFMRPVVVQTISPIMLENFREILECHYDHLPRRSHDFEAIQTRSPLAPSMKNHNELQQLRASMTESTIESLKCEAKLDVIDNTTSEPLYAEIPCWRPPSEHAVEIINLNGEAVTEL